MVVNPIRRHNHVVLVFWIVVAWLLVPLPVAVVVGRALVRASERDAVHAVGAGSREAAPNTGMAGDSLTG